MIITAAIKSYNISTEDERKKLKDRIYRFAHAKKTKNGNLKKHEEMVLRYIGFQLKPHIETDQHAKDIYNYLLKRLKTELKKDYDETHFDQDPRTPKQTTGTKARKSPSKTRANVTFSLDKSPYEPPEKTEQDQIIKDQKEKPSLEQFSDPEFCHKRIKDSKKAIIEHGIRRTELFFLTLVAFYNKKREIFARTAEIQNGNSTPGYNNNACHSSIFPSFCDKTKLEGPKTKARVKKHKEETKNEKSLLSGTYFFQVLNATVELMTPVNNFDSYLEFKSPETVRMRKALTPVLQKVSDGDWTPAEGMERYFKKMKTFFESRSVKSYVKNSGKYASPKTRSFIKKCQEKGVFYWADKKKSALTAESLSCLLRVPVKEAKAILANPEESSEHYKTIQDEILKTTYYAGP